MSSGFTIKRKVDVIATLEGQDAKIQVGILKNRDWAAVITNHFKDAKMEKEKTNCKQNAKNWLSQKESLKKSFQNGLLHP